MATEQKSGFIPSSAMIGKGELGQSPDSNNELEFRPTVSLLEFQPPTPITQKDVWKATLEGKQNAQLIEVLNAVLPPVNFVDEATGTTMVKRVSSSPSGRDDVIALQMRLDQYLQERQARDTGICPVREELYSQCFDELIRQITIESPERGLLLLRVRDEARMSVAAYQTLYSSSIAFGARKTMQSEQGNSELQQRIDELDVTKRALQSQLQDLKGLFESIEKRNAETKALEDKKALEEADFLNHQATHLQSFLNSVGTSTQRQ